MTTWLMAIAAVVAAERLTASASPLIRMLAICAALFYGMKGVVLARGPRLPLLHAIAFTFGWFGMRPGLFLDRRPRGGAVELGRRGAIELAIGLALVGAARLLRDHAIIATLLLLPGLSLTVHFGLFNLLAALWRRVGFDVGPLFRAPLAAAGLGEFWGRRWNLAFSEMTAIAVYRPLKRHGTLAVLAAFLFSGILHELAISLPVRAAFGLPTLYFLAHGALVALERRWPLGRVVTLAAIILPLPLVFTPPFVTRVLWPIVAISAFAVP